MLFTDLVLLCCMVYLTWVVLKNHSRKMNLRMVVILLSLMNSLYVFYHYGIQYVFSRAHTFFIIEIFRYINIALICYYYCDKASGLLNHRRGILLFLKTFLAIGLFLITSGGSFIMYTLSLADASKDLCHNISFNLWRYLSLVMSFVFYSVTMLIKKKIEK